MTKNKTPRLEIIILAAGLGTRMKSQLPKVLHRVCGETMISLLMRELDEAAVKLGLDCYFNIVVGHGRELVRAHTTEIAKQYRLRSPITFTVQDQQLGTGHAVRLALENSEKPRGAEATLTAVFNGDLPMFTAQAFYDFLNTHQKEKSFASLGSATLPDAGQYGRVVRSGKKFTGVVEFKDASVSQRKIREYNGGVYLFDSTLLREALDPKKGITNRNASGEFYLPDVFSFASRKKKKKIHAHHFDDSSVLAGVNNMKELAEAQKMLFDMTAQRLLAEGVFLHDPSTSWIGPKVSFESGCSVGRFTSILGNTRIGANTTIQSFCEIRDVLIGCDSVIKNSCVLESAVVGDDCAVGPMAHFRPGSKIGNSVKIGNFVELKETNIGDQSAVSHLSYLGDAKVGRNVNVGCGFVTCNYDGTVRNGKRKHESIIHDNVFIGSDCQVVAPIEIAAGTFIASGSTVSESVPEEDSLVIARIRQTVKPGYAKKYKKPSK